MDAGRWLYSAEDSSVVLERDKGIEEVNLLPYFIGLETVQH